MTAPVPVAFCWSGGKDSALALGRLLRDARYELRCLVTTTHGPLGESSVHGLPEHLLQAQADAIGLPLRTVALSGPGLEDYTEVMGREGDLLRETGIRAVAFGDLAHSGALAYREELFTPRGLSVIEPLWDMTSRECINDFLSSQIDAVTVVVDASVLGRDHLGVTLDRAFVDALPEGCDPCGELGEYHTFVANAAYFRQAVPFATGGSERIERRIGTRDGIRTFAYWRLRLE